MASPACEIKDGVAAYVPTSGGVNVTPAATIVIRLMSQADVETWSITCLTTDELSTAATVNASLVINTAAKTATFTAPVAGRTYRFQSIVGAPLLGYDRNGVRQPTYTTTFCIYTLAASGSRVHALDETVEGGTFGYAASINPLLRTGGSGGTAGKTVVAMADANQTLTDAEGRKGLVQTTGALTEKRKLTFAVPAANANSYTTPVLNTCTGDSILVSVGTGNEVEIEPGAKAIVQITASGILNLVDVPLDPRDFGCPWDGVNDDLPGLILMQQAIPATRARTTVVKLPKGQGYCSDNLEIFRKLHVIGQGKAYQPNFASAINGLRFPPLKGIIVHGDTSTADVPASGGAGSTNDTRFIGVNLGGQSAVVSDAVGNWGRAMFHMDTSIDVWEQAPATVVKGACLLKSGAAGAAVTVGSPITEYYGDGHTRNTAHLVWFRCTTSGTKGSAKPASMASGSGTGLANIGTTVAATGGTAVWTVESVPKDYVNGASLFVGQRVFLPGDNAHVFICLNAGAGTMAAGEATTLAASMNGLDFAAGISTITVASTVGFPELGIIRVVSSGGFQFVTYSSKDATNFFGCSRTENLPTLTGTMATGGAVAGPYRAAPWGVPVMSLNHHMTQPAHRAEFYDIGTAIGGASIGLSLPQATINIASSFGTKTAGFANAGTLNIWTGAAYATVAYTGRTDTSFTGCTGGTGTLAEGAEVGQGAFWREEHNGLFAILSSWITFESGNIYGPTNGAFWISSLYKRGYSGGSHFFTIRDSSVHFAGQCFKNTGNNSNGGSTENIQGHFLAGGRTNVDFPTQLNVVPSGAFASWGTGRWGNGGDIIVDRLQGLCVHKNHYLEASGGTGYRNDVYSGFVPAGNSSVWEQIALEADLSPTLVYPAVVKNPPHNISAKSTAIIFGVYSRNINTSVPLRTDTTKRFLSWLGPFDERVPAAFRMQVSGETYPTDWHCSEDLTYWTPKWFVFGKGVNEGWITEQSLAVPREGATLPGGGSLGGIRTPWICQNYAFFGIDPSVAPSALGFSTSYARLGIYGDWAKAGNVLFNNGEYNAGDLSALGWRCKVTGTPGTWEAIVNSKVHNARYVAYANVADLAAFVVAQDGVTGVEGDIVLLANQTTAAQCGLYRIGTVAAGVAPLTRAQVMPTGLAYFNGCTVEASEGTVFAGSSWKSMATGAKVVGTDDPLFYPRVCQGVLTLAAGTKTLGSAEGFFLWTTAKAIHCTMNTPGGTLTATTAYGCNTATRTAGKSGTAAATIIARVAAGTIDTANTSTVDWSVQNW